MEELHVGSWAGMAHGLCRCIKERGDSFPKYLELAGTGSRSLCLVL